MAALNLFALDADSVRRHHFPNLDAFSAGSRPSLVTVTEAITEEAGYMSGRLQLKLIDPSAITVVTSSAYVRLKRILRMQVAARLARDIPGVDTKLAAAWKAEVDAFYELLDDSGVDLLGDGATATGASDAGGPTSHISVNGLTTMASGDMSTAVPLLRKDDRL